MIWATPMLAGLVMLSGSLSGCVSLNYSRLHAGLDDDGICEVVRSVLRYEMEFDAANVALEGLGLGLDRDSIWSSSEDRFIYPVYGNGFVNKTGFKGVTQWPEEIELRFDDLGRLVEVVHRDGYLPGWRTQDKTIVSIIPLVEGNK